MLEFFVSAFELIVLRGEIPMSCTRRLDRVKGTLVVDRGTLKSDGGLLIEGPSSWRGVRKSLK
jgi:hypothetical protein